VNGILVTGAAGFIGSNFVRQWLATETDGIVSLDALTYSGNLANLEPVCRSERHRFVHGDVCDAALVESLLRTHRPRAIVHFAAESHVDRSILGPEEFIRTNIGGTFALLQATLRHWNSLDSAARARFRFVHVSTDEVYGSLETDDPPFTEAAPYRPNSPYAASKAASDHLARAWHATYGLPVVTTNCSNNYGPFQFPEKLIPLVIARATAGEPLPIYGDGGNIRDWLYVEDHCDALRRVLERGEPGSTYNIGGDAERTNLEVVERICALLDELRPEEHPYRRLLSFVPDRPGHDRRYAIDATRIRKKLGWRPRHDFDAGLRRTVSWYLDHPAWVADVTSGAYREWIAEQYRHPA